MVFDWYLNRELSIDAIVAELNRLAIPSKKGSKWGGNAIGWMLRNPAYAGHYVRNKTGQGKFYRCNGDEVIEKPEGVEWEGHSERRPSSEWTIIENQHEPII